MNAAQYERWGWKIRPLWDGRGPGVHRSPHGTYMYRDARWLDHGFRLVSPEGQTTYISAPYDLDEENLSELAALANEGWDITVRGDGLYFPGATVQVRFRRQHRSEVQA